MEFNELPILNGKLVTAGDMGKLLEVLEYNDEQGESFRSSAYRGANMENCIYLFPKRCAKTEEYLNVIKSIMDKYGVKSDIHVSHYHGVHQVVRMIIETNDQNTEYREFGRAVSKFVTQKHYAELRIAEQKRIEAEKAARQAKIEKIFPIVRLFQKKK